MKRYHKGPPLHWSGVAIARIYFPHTFSFVIHWKDSIMPMPTIKHIRAYTVRGGGADYHDQATATGSMARYRPR